MIKSNYEKLRLFFKNSCNAKLKELDVTRSSRIQNNHGVLDAGKEMHEDISNIKMKQEIQEIITKELNAKLEQMGISRIKRDC